jgi:hypothetical protein
MNLVEIQTEVKGQLANKEVLETLVATTFKGLNPSVIPQAIVAGMVRGFTFKDFLEKNIYAIPFKDTYSLVTSIDYARKIGMRSGVIGVSAPNYEAKDEKVISCSITVKRKIDEMIGEFTSTVYFSEYYKTNNYKNSLWDTKPRTMIAKVAEMHALRKACPEVLSQAYTEDEIEEEPKKSIPIIVKPTNQKSKILALMRTLKADTSSKEMIMLEIKRLTGIEIEDADTTTLDEVQSRLSALIELENESRKI